VGNADTSGSGFPAAFFTSAGTAVQDLLREMADPTTDVGGLIAKTGIDSSFDNAEVIKMKVTGTRRF
jgi:hypothetical protein